MTFRHETRGKGKTKQNKETENVLVSSRTLQAGSDMFSCQCELNPEGIPSTGLISDVAMLAANRHLAFHAVHCDPVDVRQALVHTRSPLPFQWERTETLRGRGNSGQRCNLRCRRGANETDVWVERG